jgi:predicted PurR-regulated permease PerM
MADWMLTEGRLRTLLLVAATALGLYLCYLLALPFLPALTWALVLSVMLLPMHRRIEARTGHADLAAIISVIVAAIAVVVPVLYVAQKLVIEAVEGAVYLEGQLRGTEWRDAIAAYPRLGRSVEWLEARLDFAGAAANLAEWLTVQSTSFLRGSVNQLINLLLTFYLLFYFLRDRQRAWRTLADFSPLSRAATDLVARRFMNVVHATIFGTLGIAAVQGALSGLMFWWLGLPLPLFWGVVIGLLAIVPVLGAFVVWVPAAVYLAFEGHWIKALILAAWGGIIVGGIDNLLYPVLVGNRLKLHTVPALIGLIGGVILFGASGLVLGPAVIVVTLALVEILKRHFRSEAIQHNDRPRRQGNR